MSQEIVSENTTSSGKVIKLTQNRMMLYLLGAFLAGMAFWGAISFIISPSQTAKKAALSTPIPTVSPVTTTPSMQKKMPDISQNGPWKYNARIWESSDGTTFTKESILVKSADVPSATVGKDGTIYVSFQWFPSDNEAAFDKVAVITSKDQGKNWSTPTTVTVSGLPSGFQRPFDPTILALPDGRIRLYFTSGLAPTKPQQLGGTDTTETQIYSAISSDGVSYNFEKDARFSVAGKRVYDVAVAILNGMYHLAVPAGPPQDGALHGTGANGLQFTKQATIPSSVDVNWTGNFVNFENGLRFYGWNRNKGVWFSSSQDGNTWTPVTYVNILGKDPAVIKAAENKYLLISPEIPVQSEQQNKPPQPS